MRVDWSSNLVESALSFDPLAGLKSDAQDLEKLAYRVDPTDPDAPVFDPDHGYFDVTNKVYVKPRVLADGIPSCYYFAAMVVGGTYPFGTCDPTEAKIRLSFRRVSQPGDADFRDYEAREWDGARFNAHGAFTTDRLGYDRRYGVIDSKWHHLINRYNIWDKSHLDIPCTASVDADNDGTDDACAAGGASAGSRCDDLAGQCTIPYALRTTRPNAWHYNLNTDDTVIFDSTNHAAEEWDTAMRIAVQAARRVECQRTQGASVKGTPWEGQACDKAFPIIQTDDAEVESVRKVNACWKEKGFKSPDCAPQNPNSVAALDPIITLCHNPVLESDNRMCGAAGLVTRPGDIRYHQVNVVPTPQTGSPWGLGPSLADPLTGEVIQAGINVWNYVTDQTAQLIVDEIRWMNGEISDGQITTGDYVTQYAQAASAHMPGTVPLMTPAAVNQRVLGTGATTPDKLANRAQLMPNVSVAKVAQELQARMLDAMHTPANLVGVGGATSESEARIELAKGSPVEAALMSAPWRQMAGVADSEPLTDDLYNRASPLRGLDGKMVSRLQGQVRATLAQKGQCLMAAPEPTGLVPLAKIMKAKFPYVAGDSAANQSTRIDKMWNYIRGKLNYAVIAHEMGHTVGMRHNFASSWDKFNYRPQYWQLRTRGGTVKQVCTGPVADGSQCVGPRWYDPLDQDEIDQMIWMWSQTTVMDYAGDVTQDMLGLGVFDYSAARAFYADVVDVRNDGVKVPPSNLPLNMRSDLDKIGSQMFGMIDGAISPLAEAWVNDESDPNSPHFLHYSEFNNFFHLLDPSRCQAVDTSAPPGWDADKNGEYSAVFDGHIVRGERCDRMPVDYVDWRDMIPDRTSAPLENYNPLFVLARRAVDNQGRPRMPYAFCSDEWVEAGLPSCYQHDNGADIVEETMFHDRLYEDRHLFDNYRRGRTNFTIYGAYQRTASRYHGKLESLAGQYAFFHDNILRPWALDNLQNWGDTAARYEGEGGPFAPYVLASSLAIDHFTRALARPQPGPHFFARKDTSVLRPYDDAYPGDTGDILDMNQGSTWMSDDVSYGGRPIQNTFASTDGYYVVNSAGSYYDKTYAIRALLSQSIASANWTRAEGVDARWLESNLTNLYPDGARRLIGALLTEDQATYAPRVATRASGLPIINKVGVFQYPGAPVGWVSFTPAGGPAICWPTQGSDSCTDVKGTPLPGAAGAAPTQSLPIDPELGFEVQKFILFYAYVFLPRSEKNDWLDMLRIFKLGGDVNPSFDASQMVQWDDPQTGYHYYAKRFGDEQMMGKSYDKGVGAKMLQWANTLSARAYAPADPAAPFDPQTGRFIYKVGANGAPVVLPDPAGTPPDDPQNVRCDENAACVQLRNYRGLIDFSRDVGKRVGFNFPCLSGVYQPGTWCD
jgi:hypothetical protein